MRRQNRTEVSVPVQVMWKDRLGNDKFTTAQSIDICQSGMRLQAPEQIPERSYVTLKSEKLGLHGSASIRSCSRKGTRYLVGIEFSGGMSWTPPPEKTKAPAIPLEVDPAEPVSR
jgi:hypothetical protein